MLSLQGAEGPSSFSFPSLLSWEGSARAAQWEWNGTQCSEAELQRGMGCSNDGSLFRQMVPLTLRSQAVSGP